MLTLEDDVDDSRLKVKITDRLYRDTVSHRRRRRKTELPQQIRL